MPLEEMQEPEERWQAALLDLQVLLRHLAPRESGAHLCVLTGCLLATVCRCTLLKRSQTGN